MAAAESNTLMDEWAAKKNPLGATNNAHERQRPTPEKTSGLIIAAGPASSASLPANREQKGGRYLVTRGGRFCMGGGKEGGKGGDDGVYIVHRCCDKEGGAKKGKTRKRKGRFFRTSLVKTSSP